ncbi:hypothetical protein D915_003834 [Fasciola hepatica]|uniref:Soluble interferon alpha/beta receptor OPG204 n=1 Tax=Fasciola hepatica TaxID=6192 RepID=A0A4E0RCC1_FASHE|nr:hypothetical protein D915_003834 [Fasciola hepatica]
MSCFDLESSSRNEIEWFKERNGVYETLSKGYLIEQGQLLKLETLSKSDEGEYVCDVYDGRYRIASRWMKVTVGEHETFVEGQPTVIHVTTGQSVKLPCRVKPGINIIGFHWRWMPNSELFHDHASTENLDISTELFITSVTKEHEGQYWCTVDTNQGRAVRWINLIVSENPAFQSGQKFVYREWGRSGVRLTCLVNSDIRAVEIRWVQKHDNSDWVEYITTNPTLGRALVSQESQLFQKYFLRSPYFTQPHLISIHRNNADFHPAFC